MPTARKFCRGGDMIRPQIVRILQIYTGTHSRIFVFEEKKLF